MKVLSRVVLGLGLALSSSAASADPWKDESGKGRERGAYDDGYPSRGHGYGREPWLERYGAPHYGGTERRGERREVKEEFWDGPCKVKRKWDGDEYKEERKCKRAPRPSFGYRY